MPRAPPAVAENDIRAHVALRSRSLIHDGPIYRPLSLAELRFKQSAPRAQGRGTQASAVDRGRNCTGVRDAVY